MSVSYIDLIIRIKNGYLAKKEVIEAKYSRLNEEILKKLKINKFIKDFQIKEERVKKIIVYLNYEEKEPIFTDIKIYSKPGRRWYCSYRDIKPVLGGLGLSIISTSKGVITDKEAKKSKIGGELLFSIW